MLGLQPRFATPYVFSKGITPDIWEEFQSEPVSRLNNKAVMGQYPPGSTFKMVTALAALEAGVINANTSVFCPGHYEYGQGKFHCWKKEGHGTVSVVRALAESCDVFFYRIATDLGIDRIAAMARKLGLGDKFDFELSEEAPDSYPIRHGRRKNSTPRGSREKPSSRRLDRAICWPRPFSSRS